MSVVDIDRARWDSTELVLLDIEGTISSISFVKDVLYPYALDRLTTLARHSWSDPSFQALIAGFPEDTRSSADALIAHVEDLTKRDVKAVYLKEVQGHLWRDGYTSGALTTPLFPDVLPSLEKWTHQAGKFLAIFSSGSVRAQLQFFSHVKTEDGETKDVTPLFEFYFDTVTAGPKMEKASYATICDEVDLQPTKIAFLTDNVKEAIAADEAGLYAILADRPGNAPLTHDDRSRFPVIQSLEQLP